MISSTLIPLLKSLNNKAHRDLKLWLSSPLFNKSEGLVLLYQMINSSLGTGTIPPSREKIWQSAFPTEIFTEKQWNYQIHWLLNQIRDFLAWREWQEDKQQTTYYQCKAMRKLNQDKLFMKAYRKGLQTLEKAPFRDEQYYQNLLQLKQELLKFSSVRHRGDIPELIAENDFMYQTIYQFNHLRAKCQPAAAQAIDSFRQNASIPVGIQIYEALQHANLNYQDSQYYEVAKSLFLQHLYIFQSEEQRTLYLLFINYSIHQMNNGNTSFSAETFQWYKDGLEKGVLLENDQLSTSTYKNIVNTGLRLEQQEWVLNFLEEYKEKLPPKDRYTTYSYILAVYYFNLPDYDTAMELLRDLDWGKDIYAALDARAMLLRIYYEKGYFQALDALLDSFQVFLRRNRKNISYSRSHYDNLVKIVRMIIQPESKLAANRQAILNTINELQNLAEREWLLRQISAEKKS